METPIQILQLRLYTLELLANQRGFSKKKKEAKALIPAFEAAINILEEHAKPSVNQRHINCRCKMPMWQIHAESTKQFEESQPVHFLCDICGKWRTGKRGKVFDENLNIQEGLIACQSCVNGSLEVDDKC